MQRGWAEASEERAAKHFLDICCDDVVSSYELCLFIKWFGPMELAFRNLILTLKSGYVQIANLPLLCIFLPSCTSQLL